MGKLQQEEMDNRTIRIRDSLVHWFCRHGKSYPWRETHDPWSILVSEIMLQQTTIPTVLARYSTWMRTFPTPGHLARASEEQALRSWEGLGYYRRVRSLRATAIAIVEQYDGAFPSNPADIMKLPGIGEYTCGAVLSFAFNIPAPIVDANVSRVIARLDNYHTSVDSTPGKKHIWKRAAELVSPTHAREFNSALMELGQTYCTPRTPNCRACPVQEFCLADTPDLLPIKAAKPKVTALEHHDMFYRRGDSILLALCTDGRHIGMYRFPERPINELAALPLLAKQSYSVTKYKVTRYLHHLDIPPHMTEGEAMIPIAELAKIPMASPDRKLLSHPAVAPLLD